MLDNIIAQERGISIKKAAQITVLLESFYLGLNLD